MPRSWISVPIGHGIRIADAELRPRLPSWRKYELCHGLIKAAEARGEKMTKDEAAYIIDKALAVGLIDSSGGLNFHGKGTRDEIVGQIMATSKAWGAPLTREEAMHTVSREIAWPRRTQRLALRATLGLLSSWPRSPF
jgi:hypothetical protein